MTVRRKTATNRRRKKPKHSPLFAVIVTIVLVMIIGSLLYLLQRGAGPVGGKPADKAVAVEKQKMPARLTPPVMEHNSSAVVPAPEATAVTKPAKVGKGTVVVIVDDMGKSLQEAESLFAIDVPITLSIIPGLAKVKEVAEAAHSKGRQVMIHVPMEPKGYQQKPFEKNGLLLALSEEEIEKRMQDYVRAVPYAVGANNHMGSRFTEDREKMAVALKVLKGKGMFFIDSKTSPMSIGESLAREMGIRAASRNVFLDNEQDIGAIKAQIQKLADMARKNGKAIGICHPHKTTLQALEESLPGLKAEGINFAYASAVVK